MNAPDLQSSLERIAALVETHPPATAQQLAALELELNVSIPRDLRRLYEKFNGFVTNMPGSQITLWPVEQLIKEQALLNEDTKNGIIAIGDFLVFSDLIIVQVLVDGPVTYMGSGEVLAKNLADFISRLGSGDYNL